MSNELTPDDLSEGIEMLNAGREPDDIRTRINQCVKAWQASIDLAEKLKQEAQIHAQEARGLKASLHECYQAVGAQKGNWNGARPIVEAVAAKDKRIAELHATNLALLDRIEGLEQEIEEIE